ncbi:hypothetical protein FOZ61_002785 [Perkinsus olseni]|uniref:Uncharacterized protein n=1 Tax=Perkinsus olseni TaxID=32597 RepID=A0A7J6LS32_PEROL|nr:hypothetical protein FOZ61_002785 [Perkinsus olseni]KAF4669256.1 hypothetical protein FOL46_001516 [Perkinsus olseni]
MSSSSYDLGIGIDPPSAAGGYLADDESILDDDLSFLQIAVTRMDSTLCEEMTSACRRAALQIDGWSSGVLWIYVLSDVNAAGVA